MQYKSTLIIGICLLFCLQLSAQSIFFSQYLQVPALLNPALTADFGEGNKNRLSGHYRTQPVNFNLPFAVSTTMLAYERSIGKDKPVLGFGGIYLRQRYGFIEQNYFKLNLSYQKQLNESNAFGVGINTDLIYAGLNPTTNPTGPAFVTGSNLAVNAGLNWIYTTYDANRFNLGLAIYGIGRPIKVPEWSNTLPAQLRLHASYTVSTSTKVHTVPSLMYFYTSRDHATIFGNTFWFELAQSTNHIQLGTFLRFNTDYINPLPSRAFVSTLGYSSNSWRIQLSYDFSLRRVAGLRTVTDADALELFLARSF